MKSQSQSVFINLKFWYRFYWHSSVSLTLYIKHSIVTRHFVCRSREAACNSGRTRHQEHGLQVSIISDVIVYVHNNTGRVALKKKNNCKTEVFLHPVLLRPLMRTSLLNLLTHIYRSRLLHVYFKAHVDHILNIFNRKLLLYVQWSILTLNKISVGHVLRFAGRLGISVAYVWYPPDKGFWKIDPIYANNLPNFQFWGMLETLLYIYYLLSISITWYIYTK